MFAQKLFGKLCPKNLQKLEITGIACDSRRVEPGNVFVAVSGKTEDGAAYIADAVKRGAVLVVAENPPAAEIPYIHTDAPRRTLAELAAVFYGRPAEQIGLIGVTGTNGKTTVTYLIESILKNCGYKVGVIGTNGITLCNEPLAFFTTTPTTPDAIELQAILAEFVRQKADFAVMEVSSHALALERVFGCRYRVGVFTNLTRDHLDFHGTMENYMQAKKQLFSISEQAVINIDDDWSAEMLRDISCPVLTTGLSKADVVGGNLLLSAKGVEFDVSERGRVYPVRLGIPGKFSVYNALSAIGACAALGIEPAKIQAGLEQAKGVCGRAEVLSTDTDYTVMIDYAHSPDGLEKILDTVRGFAKGKIIIVFGCGGDRDKTKRPQMGKIAAEKSDLAVVTSDNPRTEDPMAIIGDITAGIEKENYIVIPDRRRAIREALLRAETADVVLLAGKGQETYQILGTEKIEFDERKIVMEILEKIQQENRERM